MTRKTHFVGLDVGKFEICVFRQDLGQPFPLPNTQKAMPRWWKGSAIRRARSSYIEPTGGECGWAVWEVLDAAGFAFSLSMPV